MKTADLIEQVAAKAGIARSAAKEAVEAMLTGIIDAARQGDAVQVKVDTHYPRNLCWDCHYSHNPKKAS